jgi:hypothetical protein
LTNALCSAKIKLQINRGADGMSAEIRSDATLNPRPDADNADVGSNMFLFPCDIVAGIFLGGNKNGTD